MNVTSTTKNFHFQELNWIISFPQNGNQGKYVNYTVTVKKASELEKKQRLGEVLESQEFEQKYPHTVRYYKSSPEKAFECPRDLLEIRGINCVEDFWMFLNSLDI